MPKAWLYCAIQWIGVEAPIQVFTSGSDLVGPNANGRVDEHGCIRLGRLPDASG